MEWFDRGGAEGAADFVNGDVLCDLQDADEGFRSAEGPDWESVEEDWEYNGMENNMPVVEVDPPD